MSYPFITDAKYTQVLPKPKMFWKLGYFSPSSLHFLPGLRHREVWIVSAVLTQLTLLPSIIPSKAIAEIKLLNWIHMLKFSHKHLISVFFFLFSLNTTKQTKKEKKTKAKKTEENNEIDACSSAF